MGVGARHRGVRSRLRAASGSRSTRPTTKPPSIWRDEVGFPPERIQRLGDKDNFWQMADTGPCGYISEIFWDLGPEYGPEGGPAVSEDRYVEFWNLVFMQFDQRADGTRVPLPKPSVDTGAGLERWLAIAAGRRHGVGHRRVPPADRDRRARHRRALRHVPGHRAGRLAADPRRARSHDDLPRRRRRRAVERGARLRAAAHHPARGAARVPARRRRSRHAGARRCHRRGHGRRLPRHREAARPDPQRRRPRGRAVPPDARSAASTCSTACSRAAT